MSFQLLHNRQATWGHFIHTLICFCNRLLTGSRCCFYPNLLSIGVISFHYSVSLVAAYMLHNGYLESARALGGWVSKASTSPMDSPTSNLGTSTEPLLNGSAIKEPPDPDDVRTPLSDVCNLTSPESVNAPKSGTNGQSIGPHRAETNGGLKELFQWPEATELLLKRRQLRDMIRAGDYLSALEHLETHFQSLSEQDPSISFVLRCHHFIDLVSRDRVSLK